MGIPLPILKNLSNGIDAMEGNLLDQYYENLQPTPKN